MGIVAGVCREIGLVEWLDQQAGERRNLVSIGRATMANKDQAVEALRAV
ncbi:MAG TPA: hypothetical protein VFA10_17625 [Ktedonobacteraceae bacterium]|nr:hypothetical protein [Ktedonobacteraceae bacterium]